MKRIVALCVGTLVLVACDRNWTGGRPPLEGLQPLFLVTAPIWAPVALLAIEHAKEQCQKDKNRYETWHEQQPDQIAKLRSEVKDGSLEAEFELASQLGLSSDEGWIWLCRAADDGHARARFLVGLWYERYLLNQVHAYKWYSLADKDNYCASESKKRLFITITLEELDEANHLIAVWKPGECEKNQFLNRRSSDN